MNIFSGAVIVPSKDEKVTTGHVGDRFLLLEGKLVATRSCPTKFANPKGSERRWGLIHHSEAPVRKIRGSFQPHKKVGKKKSKRNVGKVQLPPLIEVTPRLRQTFRFYTTQAQTAKAIVLRNIFGALGGICTVVNNTFKSWTTSFKIASLDMYLPNGGQGEIAWVVDNTDQGPDEAYDATIPANISVTEGIHTSPPERSIASDWVNAAADMTDELFRITCSNSGAVIDMDVEYSLPNEFSVGSISIVAGVLGTAYYLSLDHNAGNQIAAINRPTTT